MPSRTSHGHTSLHHMTEEEKDRIAHEKFGKAFNELDTNQKKSVGASHPRPGHTAAAHNMEEESEGTATGAAEEQQGATTRATEEATEGGREE